jgi:hypothetical protein
VHIFLSSQFIKRSYGNQIRGMLREGNVQQTSVCIATMLWAGPPRNWGSIAGRGKRLSSNP